MPKKICTRSTRRERKEDGGGGRRKGGERERVRLGQTKKVRWFVTGFQGFSRRISEDESQPTCSLVLTPTVALVVTFPDAAVVPGLVYTVLCD